MNEQSNTVPVAGRTEVSLQRGPPTSDAAQAGNGRPVTTMLIPAGISVVPIPTRRISRRIPHTTPPHHHRLRVGTPIPLPLVRKSEVDTQSTASGVMCRICFSGEEAGKLGKFCQCAGTIEYCHHQCLTRWIQQSNMQNCELCGYPYRMQQRPMCIWRWHCPPFQPLQQFFFCIYLVAWIALLGSAGWLLFVTFGFDSMYRDSELAPLIYGLYGLIAVAALGIIFFETIFVVKPFCNTLFRYNRETVVMPYDERTSQLEAGTLVAEVSRRPPNPRYNYQRNLSQNNFDIMRHGQRTPASESVRTMHHQCFSRENRYSAVAPHQILSQSAVKIERNNSSVNWPMMLQNTQMMQPDAGGSFRGPFETNPTILNFARPVRNLHVASIANQHVYCRVYAQNSARNKTRPNIDNPVETIQPMPSSSDSSYNSCSGSTHTTDTLSYTGIPRHVHSGNSLQMREFSHQWVPVICSSSEIAASITPIHSVRANYISMPSIEDSTSNFNIYLPCLQPIDVDISSSEEQLHQHGSGKIKKGKSSSIQQELTTATSKSLLHKCIQSPSIQTESSTTTPDTTSATKVNKSETFSETAANNSSHRKLHRMYHSDTSLVLAVTSSLPADEMEYAAVKSKCQGQPFVNQ